MDMLKRACKPLRPGHGLELRASVVLQWLLAAAGMLLVVFAASEVYRTACDPTVNLHHFFKFDTLYPAALYEDLTCDFSSLNSWRFTGATDLYPDLLIYAVAKWVTGEVAPAMVVCTCAIFGLLVLATVFLLGSVTDHSDRLGNLAAVFGMAALFLLLNVRCRFTYLPLTMPLTLTYHAGCAICVIVGLTIALRLLFTSVWNWKHWLGLVALFVNTALCMASDRLILVQLVVPVVAAMWFARGVLGSVALPAQRIAWISATLLAAAVTGQLLLRLIQSPWDDYIHSGSYSFGSLWKGISLAATQTAQQLAAGDLLHWLAVATLALALAYVSVVASKRVLGRLDAATIDHRQFLYATSLVAICASSLGAASYSGMLTPPFSHEPSFQWAFGTRYLMPVLMLPFLLLPYTLSALARQAWPRPRSWMIAAPIVAVAAVVLYAARQQPRADGQDVWHYYPPFVREMDEAALELGLRDGMADPNSARMITMFSRQGVRVRAILRRQESPSGCGPYPTLVNINWNSPKSNGQGAEFSPSFLFLFGSDTDPDWTRSPSQADIVKRFGEPATSRSVGGRTMLVYNRPTDVAFRQIPSQDYAFIGETFSFAIREAVRYPGHSLPSSIVEPLPMRPRVAVANRESPGVLTDGPFLVMRKKGTYRIRAVVTAKAPVSNGRLEVILIDGVHAWQERVNLIELPLGDMQEATQWFQIDDRLLGRFLLARVYYLGIGTLEVHSIEVERMP